MDFENYASSFLNNIFFPSLTPANIIICMKLGIQFLFIFIRVDCDAAILAWTKKKKKNNENRLSTSNSLLEVLYEKKERVCMCVCLRASIAHAPCMRYTAIFAAYFTIYISKFILSLTLFSSLFLSFIAALENSSRQKQSNRLSQKHSSFFCLVCRSENCLVSENQRENNRKNVPIRSWQFPKVGNHTNSSRTKSVRMCFELWLLIHRSNSKVTKIIFLVFAVDLNRLNHI